jgi:hypothetical protein
MNEHILLYGGPGLGKSHMAATLDKPQYIIMFDAYGKEVPYINNCWVEILPKPLNLMVNGKLSQIPVWDVFADPDLQQLVRRIIFIHEPDPEQSAAYDTFSDLKPLLPNLIKQISAKSLILDSVSTLSEYLRFKFQKDSRAGTEVAKGEWGWAYLAANELMYLWAFLVDAKLQTCLIAHTSMNKLNNPDTPYHALQAPGQTKEKYLTAFGEVLHCFLKNNEYRVQTSTSEDYYANNSLGLKGDYPNNWSALEGNRTTKVNFVTRKEATK